MVDDIAIVRSMWTEAINHDPAITYIQTGKQLPGYPSLGAWLSYGLGSDNENLPSFVVLNSSWSSKGQAQALFTRLWGAGFLPSNHQGVAFQPSTDPILFLQNPPGVDRETRRSMLDGLGKLNRHLFEQVGDDEIQARITRLALGGKCGEPSAPRPNSEALPKPGNVAKAAAPTPAASLPKNCRLVSSFT